VPPEILAIHIMKTAGTSLRRMVTDGLGTDAVYPNDEDLRARHKGWYPRPDEYLDHVREGRHHGARVLIGHVPYVLAEQFDPPLKTVTLLRDPVGRALSMLEHRRTRSRRFRGATYQEILDDDGVVANHIRDYQTKMFAFDSVEECAEAVNVPLDIDDARFERALGRLESVDVLGVVERMPEARARLQAVTGIPVGQEQRANAGRYDREVTDEVRERLEELTARDAVLYRRALELIDRQADEAPARPGLLGRLRGRASATRRG
jgi:hypothetical protein